MIITRGNEVLSQTAWWISNEIHVADVSLFQNIPRERIHIPLAHGKTKNHWLQKYHDSEGICDRSPGGYIFGKALLGNNLYCSITLFRSVFLFTCEVIHTVSVLAKTKVKEDIKLFSIIRLFVFSHLGTLSLPNYLKMYGLRKNGRRKRVWSLTNETWLKHMAQKRGSLKPSNPQKNCCSIPSNVTLGWFQTSMAVGWETFVSVVGWVPKTTYLFSLSKNSQHHPNRWLQAFLWIPNESCICNRTCQIRVIAHMYNLPL